LDGVRRELGLAARMLGKPVAVGTVFVGGGTPSLLGAKGLAGVLDAIRDWLDLAPGAEVSVEANPESTSPEFFAGIAEAGYTRVSLGMQSSAPHVLAVLGRVHSPQRPVGAARQARAGGISHVNLDLIYGTPGERPEDVAASLEAVLGAGVDHVSAYALVIEPGTALARRPGESCPLRMTTCSLNATSRSTPRSPRRACTGMRSPTGPLAPLPGAGTTSGTGPAATGGGVGPGAHSHIGGVRWWNVKHPARYAAALSAGRWPVAGWEELSPGEQYIERVMLGVRVAEGLPLSVLSPVGRAAAERAARDGLVTLTDERLVLTLRGRLLADTVVRELLAG
jgi:oxygen-independent coproporphyrinogen-3 oxidase